jgi:hypothetical protein
MELPEEVENDMNLYSQFPKLNYDIAGERRATKVVDEKINHLAPEDYKLIDPTNLRTDNYAFFYSPSKNEIVLSIKGTTQIKEWVEENLNSIAYHVFSPDKKFIPHQDLDRKGLLVDVARKYNRLKTIEEKNKFIEESQSKMHDVILDLTEVLYKFIEKNKLDLLNKKDRPKIVVTAHSLGSSRGMGLLEAMRTIDFKSKGDPNEPNIYLKPYKIPNIFEVEGHFFNSAPYPSDEQGNFYFLNDFVQKDPETNDVIIHEPIRVNHYSSAGFIKEIGDIVSGLPDFPKGKLNPFSSNSAFYHDKGNYNFYKVKPYKHPGKKAIDPIFRHKIDLFHHPKVVKRRNEILTGEKTYKTDLESYDIDELMTSILLQEIEENVEELEEKVFEEVIKPKKRLITSFTQSLKEYCKINRFDPLCAFVKY